MATIVQCNCGAEYRRTEEKFLVPHTGDAVCSVCGAAQESWRESTHVPTYELLNVQRESRNDASQVRLIWFRQKVNIESSGTSQDEGAHFVITALSRGSYR
jgi:hypothetical protein